MRTIGCALLLGFFLVAPASAQRCPPPLSPSDAPWPDAVEVRSEVVGDDATIRLTRAEGEAIRCQLQRRLRRPVERTPSNLRNRVQGRRLGALWMDQGRPRIGSFWLQRASDGSLVLADTLSMSARTRVGLAARFEKRGGRWRLRSVSIRFDHMRSGRRTPPGP